jgi:hypothetical protein
VFASVAPTPYDVGRALPGDDLVPDADVVMDRAFDLDGPPERVWPWFVQLGKQRAGWYLPRRIEHLIPPRRRALRRLDASLLDLRVGHVIPDWGGRHATFEVAILDPPRVLVHTTQRGHTRGSWAIVLEPTDLHRDQGTHVHLRLRLAPVKHPRIADTFGGVMDAVTVAGLAAGLRERVSGG